MTIAGTGFGAQQGSGQVWLRTAAGVVQSWSDTQVVALVATGSASWDALITQNGVTSNSTSDPPILTAVAAGHVTITAGSASADVTVSPVALAPGTVLWSNPINGGEVDTIVPAVPSSTGVADVFAQSGNTVYAITSDGATAWTADLSDFQYPDLYPDFQGGLVVADAHKVAKLDGVTGQRHAAYTAPEVCILQSLAIHTDGTIFANQLTCNSAANVAVIGIDPTSGALKFQVPVPQNGGASVYETIIAGDGFAYVPYTTRSGAGGAIPNPHYWDWRLGLLRISSSGTYNDLTLGEWSGTSYYDPNLCGSCYWGEFSPSRPAIITNADAGVLVGWYETSTGKDFTLRLANVTISGVSTASGPQLPVSNYPSVRLDLQAQDGSFIGEAEDTGTYAFSTDAGGNLHWLMSNVNPFMATADGGLIGQIGGSAQAFTLDQNGNVTGQLASWPVQSWTGNLYQSQASLSLDAMVLPSIPVADASFWAMSGGNPAGSRTAYVQCPCLLQDSALSGQLMAAPRNGQAAVRSQDQQGQTYVLTVSQPGIEWNAGRSFVLASQTASGALIQSGAKSNSTPILLSAITDFANALTGNGPITGGVTPATALGMNGPIVGGVTYFGHGGWLSFPGKYESALFLSPTNGTDYNVWRGNIATLSSANLGPDAAIVLNACHAGENRNGATSIAQLLANQLKRTVWAYPVGMYYSANPAPRVLRPIGFNPNGKAIYETVNTVPLYMVPNANGVKAIPFYPH